MSTFPPKVTRLTSPSELSRAANVRLRFQVANNRVSPTSQLLTCIVYKDGDAILQTNQPTWNTKDMVVDLIVDDERTNPSDVATILLSPSCGICDISNVYWESPKNVDLTSKFVATDFFHDNAFYLNEFKAPSQAAIDAGMKEYHSTKMNIILSHLLMVGGGTGIIHVLDATDTYSKCFAIGGLVGLVYQLLMQMEIDQVGNEHKNVLYRLLGNSIFRLSFLSSLFLISTANTYFIEKEAFVALCSGFFVNKLAMYITFWRKNSET